MLSVESVPTYVATAAGAIFAVVSTPVDREVRGGVLVCSSLGKEQGHSARGIKRLAEQLAERGLVVVRFDYACTGESSGQQNSEDAARAWLLSIYGMVDYMADMGVGPITIIGHRAGALLAGDALANIGEISGLVLWDPVVRGRQFVRSQKAMYSLMSASREEVGSGDTCGNPNWIPVDYPAPTDDVHLAGITLHQDAASSVSRMTLNPELLSSIQPAPVFALLQEQDLVSPLAQSIVSVGGVIATIGDQTGFLEQTEPWYITIPEEISIIVDWVSDNFAGQQLSKIEFEPITEAVVAKTIDGDEIVTRVRCLEDGRHVWDTALQGLHENTERIVVTHSIGHDLRSGPARVYVELAHDVAERGGRCVRFDRLGVGESGVAQPEDSFIELYSQYYVEQGVSILDHMSIPDRAEITFIGICIGGWMSAKSAKLVMERFEGRNVRARAITVNPMRWNLNSAMSVRRTTSSEGLHGGRRTIGRGLVWVRQRAIKIARASLSPRTFEQVNRLSKRCKPASLVDSLRGGGAEVELIFGPLDFERFISLYGPEPLAGQARSVSVRVTTEGDHAGYHIGIRSAMKQACASAVGPRCTKATQEMSEATIDECEGFGCLPENSSIFESQLDSVGRCSS